MDKLQEELLSKIDNKPRKFRDILGHDPTPEERNAINTLIKSNLVTKFGEKRGTRYCLFGSTISADPESGESSAVVEPSKELLDFIISKVSKKEKSFRDVLGREPTAEDRAAMRTLIDSGHVVRHGSKRSSRYVIGDGTPPVDQPETTENKITDSFLEDLFGLVTDVPQGLPDILGKTPTNQDREAIGMLVDSGRISKVGQYRGSKYYLSVGKEGEAQSESSIGVEEIKAAIRQSDEVAPRRGKWIMASSAGTEYERNVRRENAQNLIKEVFRRCSNAELEAFAFTLNWTEALDPRKGLNDLMLSVMLEREGLKAG